MMELIAIYGNWIEREAYEGIRSAYAAGMSPLMVPDMIAPDEEMRKLSVGIFGDLFGVLEYLKAESITACVI